MLTKVTNLPSVALPGPLRPRQYSYPLMRYWWLGPYTYLYWDGGQLLHASEEASATEAGKEFHRGTVLGKMLNLSGPCVLFIVALWFILWGDLFYVLPSVILFLCFSVLLALRLPRLGKRELILELFVRLFDLCLFGFVGFLFLLVSGKGCGFVLCEALCMLRSDIRVLSHISSYSWTLLLWWQYVI